MEYKGIVDWFDIDKVFGFIKSNDFQNKLFVHFTAIETDGFKYLTEKDDVEFDVIGGNLGWQVKRVKKVGRVELLNQPDTSESLLKKRLVELKTDLEILEQYDLHD